MEFNMLLEPLRAFLTQVGAFMPKLLVAVVIAVAGWLVAKAVRFAVLKGLRAINFHVLTERSGMDGFLQQGGTRADTTDLLALLVYWLSILATLVLAFNSVGLDYVTDLLGRITLFVPKVILAVVIIALGSYFAGFIGATVTAYGHNVEMKDADLLGRLARYAVVGFVLLIAFDQLAIGGDLIRQSFLIILAGVVLALAVAFGIGGQKWAAAVLERWWPGRGGGKDREG